MKLMEGVSTLTKGVGQKAKGNYDIITMNGRISNLQKEIQGIYLKMGQQYYALYKERPDEKMEEFVNKVKAAEGQIDEIKQQIETIRAETASVQLTPNASVGSAAAGRYGYCTKCGKPLPAEASFCVYCGTKLDDAE